ncbi:putative signal peptide peptidase SppA [Halobacillus andaensis]|uniref:Signal peptide peptidase SppA n=1 Tax=Halobacillus andaensis TaxID=1176239 RepID=A0A917EZ27_HALAA|nr:signal peptide peptidase SppA [Halobacillus andaensis]MBP2005892.1 protease-4 [Halobacillus andaensis]GGF25279.1 putative signal peptide peptidase SppA [Halobacillus andaensis]
MKKRLIAIGIASALLIIAILIQSISFLTSSTFTESSQGLFGGDSDNEGPREEVIEEGSSSERIARLSVEGTIMSGQGSNPFMGEGYNHEALLEQLEVIKEDSSINGVLLYVNSPGGGVFESAELHDKLNELKEEDKSLYVSMGGMAASGGYYISAPADQIYASEETFTGSLGVIMQSVNYEELADEYGVKFNTIKSGEFKDIMSPTKEMTEEDREILQTLVDESYQGFVDVISEGRDMPEDEVIEIADGRIYSGQQALDNGLIDNIGFEEDALAALKEEIGGNPEVIEYHPSGETLFGIPFDVKSFLPTSEVKWINEMIEKRQGPRLMYMYSE